MEAAATISYGFEMENRPNQARPDLVSESPFFSRTELTRWPPVHRDVAALTGSIVVDYPQRLLQQDVISSTISAVFPQNGGKVGADIPPLPVWEEPANFIPRTALAKRLWELRQKIVASGEPLLSWDEIEHEVYERRGERDLGEES